MRIGFDAKRSFYNRSGLGNYSRDIIISMFQNFPANEYFLYTPSVKKSISFLSSEKANICLPKIGGGKLYNGFWRSFLLKKRLQKDHIDVYHGLSNELPQNIQNSKVKSIVTIHDLIFMRYPQWYKLIDRKIYEKKFRYGSRVADKIITVSNQTKSDLINYFNIDENKIKVIYQGCNELFTHILTSDQKNLVMKRFNLPSEYLLYVGTIEERKNLLQIIKTIHQYNIDFPLIVVGRPTHYIDKVNEYIQKHRLNNIVFLHNVTLNDLPAIYQNASMFIYPSIFEGFGIPILEALWSKVPVITSKGGCFDEVGGSSTLYVDPMSVDELGHTLVRALSDKGLTNGMIEAGYLHAQKFLNQVITGQIMELYNKVVYEQ
jgi:glycosyltransferase involved in cell wall biosynthesis